MKRNYKKLKKSLHNYRFKGMLMIAVGIFIVIGLVVKRVLSPPIFPLFHGPHLSEALYKSGINEAEVLGSKSGRSNLRLKTTPTPRPVKPTTTLSTPVPTATASPSPTPTPIINSVLNQMGIAAGGELTGLVQDKLDLYFSQLKELGVGWVRWDFDWGSIQPDGSTGFDWSGTDRVVQTANKYGIKTLGIITYTPDWAQMPVCKGSFACAPADPNSFGLFAGQVAARYAPLGVHYWEIWNEQNIVMFWKPKPDINSYISILKSAYSNIKKFDPAAFTLSGGLAAAGDEDGNIAPITFIRTLYELDPTKDFDGIAIHPYTYPALPSYSASWNSWQQMDAIRQLMIAHGDSNKPLWITEFGGPTGGPGDSHNETQLDNFVYGSDYMTENAQEMIMDDALLFFSQLKGPTGPFFWYSLRDDGTSRDTPENFFGLLRFDGSKKPAYNVFKNMISSNK